MKQTVRRTKPLKGEDGNHFLTAEFDEIGGYVGITQIDNKGRTERVLLSPFQAQELITFAAADRAVLTQRPRSVLTRETVREIRDLYASGGATLKDLAARYGVTFGTISHAINHRTWKEKSAP